MYNQYVDVLFMASISRFQAVLIGNEILNRSHTLAWERSDTVYARPAYTLARVSQFLQQVGSLAR